MFTNEKSRCTRDPTKLPLRGGGIKNKTKKRKNIDQLKPVTCTFQIYVHFNFFFLVFCVCVFLLFLSWRYCFAVLFRIWEKRQWARSIVARNSGEITFSHLKETYGCLEWFSLQVGLSCLCTFKTTRNVTSRRAILTLNVCNYRSLLCTQNACS